MDCVYVTEQPCSNFIFCYWSFLPGPTGPDELYGCFLPSRCCSAGQSRPGPGRDIFPSTTLANSCSCFAAILPSTRTNRLNPLIRLEDDVAKAAHVSSGQVIEPGDTLTYTITINPDPAALAYNHGAATYILTDTLPVSMTYLAGSASLTPASVSGSRIVWQVPVEITPTYAITYAVQLGAGLNTSTQLTNRVLHYVNSGGERQAEASITIGSGSNVYLPVIIKSGN